MDTANAMMFPGVRRRADPYRSDAGYVHYQHQSSRVLVLYSHGNSTLLEDIDTLLWTLREYLGVNVMAYEYPGYAEGNGSTQELVNRAARHYLHVAVAELGYQPRDIVLMGKSIGTGPSCLLAAENPTEQYRGVVLLSPFTSISALGRDLLKRQCGLVASLVYPVVLAATWHKYDNKSALRAAHSHVPVLLIHGVDDEVIPSSMSEELRHELCRDRSVQLLQVPGGHNTPMCNRQLETIRVFVHRA